MRGCGEGEEVYGTEDLRGEGEEEDGGCERVGHWFWEGGGS